MKKGFLQMILGPGAIFVAIIIALILVVPIVAITFSPELMLLFQIAAAIIIFNWVRTTVGPGMLSIIISVILIYIFVFVLPQFTLGLYIFYFLLITGILSTIIFLSFLFPMKPIGMK